MAEFLFEIGLEEMPARMIAGAQAELQRRVMAMLERERLVQEEVASKSFSTPRRLAIWVGEVRERQEDATEEMLGPSAKIAYKDGVATAAAVAFAKKAGVPVEALETVATARGEYLRATRVKAGRAAAEVIAAELPKELAGIAWAKNMYWRAGRPERFVRPVRWLLALLGGNVVPVEFAGYTAGNVTYGHRVLFGAEAIAVAQPGEYAERLVDAYVLAGVETRRHRIRKALDHAAREVPGLRWREDHALVDGLTHLTEWASDASVVLGTFEPEYLALPEEVLVTVMRDHQKYFALEDKAGKLAPYFLAVLNTEADASGLAVIRHGNARVLRARFNDARFFWEFDQRVPLVERVELLEAVTFQKDLGSYAAKAERVRGIAERLAGVVERGDCHVDFNALMDAARLAKTDLTCELVKEFPELQGVVGGFYARAQGLSEAAATAIYDQYLPKSMEDSVPRSVEGALLAIADKIDTIAGMFSLGLEPTGSKDPFALRRAANGIVKILAETELTLNLGQVVASVSFLNEEVMFKMNNFLLERLSFYLRDVCGFAYDVVKAVMEASGRQVDDPRDAIARAEAIQSSRGSANFTAVCNAFKRVKNILAQAKENDFQIAKDIAMLEADSEIALYKQLRIHAQEIGYLLSAKDYRGALVEISKFGPFLADFFNDVMVMTDKENLRATRLKLLSEVCSEFAQFADFAEIVVAG